MDRIECPICGIKIEDEQFESCPVCGWTYTGYEVAYEEDERDDYNLISRKEAKENFAKGLNKWGEPIR